ncbi:GTP-binding protein 10-like [Liolophura sinensis]|uniref:GTP-binding protein 10-like n=1 Tax=Liolophura sinensis TaxID=3198878 RepID=UPI0031585E55
MVWLTSTRRLLQAVTKSGTSQTSYTSKELKPKSSWTRRRAFLDSMRIYVRGGSGGQGFPRYGGLGGKGGDVYVTAVKKRTLKHVHSANPSKRFIAGNGDNSSKRKLVGDAGADCIIKVPVGVTVKNNIGRVIGDLNEEKQMLRVARGGLGGHPDNHFLGQKGQVEMVTLDLKLLADVGLVGFPNAGKSTFLSAVSRAAPKIASYPFTTIQPQIGVMEFTDHRQISVADLPGLIEGAHVNVGMGHRFLKHVERTKLLLFVVDINGFQLPKREHFRTAFETVMLLNKELELYKAELLDKPSVLAINKIDTVTDHALVTEIRERLHDLPDCLEDIDPALRPSQCVQFDDIIPISAQSGYSIEELKMRIRELLDYYADLDLQRTVTAGLQLVPHHRVESLPSLDALERNKARPV